MSTRLYRGREEVAVPEGTPYAHLLALGWEKDATPEAPTPERNEDDTHVTPAPVRRRQRTKH